MKFNVFKVNLREATSLKCVSSMEIGWMFTQCVGVKIEKLLAQPFPLWFCLSEAWLNGKIFLWSQNQIFSNSQILLLCLLVELCVIIEVSEHFLFFLLSLGRNELTGPPGIFQGWKHLLFLWIIGSPVDRIMVYGTEIVLPQQTDGEDECWKSWKSYYFLHFSSLFFLRVFTLFL